MVLAVANTMDLPERIMMNRVSSRLVGGAWVISACGRAVYSDVKTFQNGCIHRYSTFLLHFSILMSY